MSKLGDGVRKVKEIGKAFIEPLPVGQGWYEERLSICAVCPKNIANIEHKDYSFSDKAKVASGLCDNGNHCTACGCCIERKCASKTSECGLAELGEIPKWEALEIIGEVDRSISIINVTPKVGKTSVSRTEFIYDLGTTSNLKESFAFQLRRKGGLEVKNFNAPCKCTLGKLIQVDKETIQLNVDISISDLREGVNERELKVTYFEKPNITKRIHIKFKVNKNGK